jgi:hypothetical protein
LQITIGGGVIEECNESCEFATIAYMDGLASGRKVGAKEQRLKQEGKTKLILTIIERRDDPAVKLREIKEILERVKE